MDWDSLALRGQLPLMAHLYLSLAYWGKSNFLNDEKEQKREDIPAPHAPGKQGMEVLGLSRNSTCSKH